MSEQPDLIDLTIQFLNEKFPGCEVTCMPRYGYEFFVAGQLVGAIGEQMWYDYQWTKPGLGSTVTSFKPVVHVSDPEFFNIVEKSCRHRIQR